MKKITLAIALVAFTAAAFAACPVGTRYQCVPTWGGKMQCGCM